MKARNIEILIHNPFHLSKVLHHFISGVISVNEVGVKTELINIIIPFILDKKICEKLSRLNKSSKFTKIIDDKLYWMFTSQINDKIRQTKRLTNHALIILSKTEKISISEYIKTDEIIDYKKEKDLELKRIYNAAYSLGILIGKEKYLTIMNKLRITQL
jgi:hypothetical protein